MKRVITAEDVTAAHAAGSRTLAAPRDEALVTPGAWSRARELNVAINQDLGPGKTTEEQELCERVVDASGLLVVRGRSVKLGTFTGVPGKNIGLTDLVTGRDGSPMTAGIMSWHRDDSFPWKLDYDEVDLVLDGVLEISIDGRTLRGGPGDVFYIPKGSSIVFGTSSYVRVFYVTYPADWSAAASARPRPQK